MQLKESIRKIKNICTLIEDEKEYIYELKANISKIQENICLILSYAQEGQHAFEINEEFVLQVLKDIVYGIEHQDAVFLLDALRYGLLQIYYYAAGELKSEG